MRLVRVGQPFRERAERVAAIAEPFRMSWATTVRAHADSGFGIGGLRLYRPWRTADGPPWPDRILLSVNEFRPHRFTEAVRVATISAQLERQVLRTPHALAIGTSYQPRGRITYSLSLWADEQALEAFTGSAEHVEVMNTYRTRGYLRHIHWWGTHRSIGASMAEARRRLDAGQGHRAGEPRDRWGRRDQRRLAAHAGNA